MRILCNIYVIFILSSSSLCAMGDEEPVHYIVEQRSEKHMDQKMALCDALLSRLSKYAKIAALVDISENFFASKSALYIGEVTYKTEPIFAGISRASLSKIGTITSVHTALECPRTLADVDNKVIDWVSACGGTGSKSDLYTTHLEVINAACSHLYANTCAAWKDHTGIPCMPCNPKKLLASCMFSLIRKKLTGKGLSGFFINAQGTETSFGVNDISSAHALYEDGAFENLTVHHSVSKGTPHVFTLLFMK